jgi:glycosyltransferase involved in cell wall biosynthesis
MADGPGLRVDLLSPVFWPEVRRGTERFAHELATGLAARGHRPVVVTTRRGRPLRSVQEGVEVVALPRPPGRMLYRRRFENHLPHVPPAYAALERRRPDVAQALHPTDGLAAARYGRRTGRPSILSYMGIAEPGVLASRKLRMRITTAAARGVDAVVVLSRAAARAFEREIGVHARVIHPGVNTERFSPGGERAPQPTILCAAALNEPRKRGPVLLDAFACVRRERPDARLVLQRPRDEAFAAELAGAGEGIELRDLDGHAALLAANREAWVVALPSRAEAFGLVLTEALACGTPVVASDEGAFPEIVDRPEVGRLFARPEGEAMARTLLETLELATDRATEAACRARAEDFSTARCAAAYEALYRELGARD